MSQHASQTEINKFVQVVDEFKFNYARLLKPETRDQVYASQNAGLIAQYESAVSKSGILNSTINATVGAWDAYKRGTAKTSMIIGDAIDTVRGWFGYDPDGGLSEYDRSGLGALQIPAAIAVTGIIGSAIILNKLITSIFVTLEANKLQRENPNIDRLTALTRAKASVPSLLPTGITPVMLGFGAIALYLMFGGRK